MSIKFVVSFFKVDGNNFNFVHLAGYPSFPSRSEMVDLFEELAMDEEFGMGNEAFNLQYNVFDKQYMIATFPDITEILDEMDLRYEEKV
jgi:hypothetical protein